MRRAWVDEDEKDCEGQRRRRTRRGGWRRGVLKGDGEDKDSKEEANGDCRVNVIQRGGVYN